MTGEDGLDFLDAAFSELMEVLYFVVEVFAPLAESRHLFFQKARGGMSDSGDQLPAAAGQSPNSW